MPAIPPRPSFLLVAFLASVVTGAARPSLPPVADIALVAQAHVVSPPADGEPLTAGDIPHETVAELQRRPYLRAYEATSVGYTVMEDEHFLDFTLSLMVPLFHGFYPDQDLSNDVEAGSALRPYFAFTGRAGQYLNTRNSQPVVGKRFNPLLSARYWWWEDGASAAARADTFVEFVYAHESNGQWITNEAAFQSAWDSRLVDELNRLEQEHGQLTDALRRRAMLTSYESALDEISRGWDYIGLNLSMRGGRWLPNDRHRLQLKLSAFLDWGLLQQDKEEYSAWENDPEGKPRSRVDGIELRYDGRMSLGRGRLLDVVEFGSEWAVIWKTGIAQPFRYNTFEVELGLLINEFPLKLWYRYGYMHELVGYHRKESAGGLRFSFNRFSRDETAAAVRAQD